MISSRIRNWIVACILAVLAAYFGWAPEQPESTATETVAAATSEPEAPNPGPTGVPEPGPTGAPEPGPTLAPQPAPEEEAIPEPEPTTEPEAPDTAPTDTDTAPTDTDAVVPQPDSSAPTEQPSAEPTPAPDTAEDDTQSMGPAPEAESATENDSVDADTAGPDSAVGEPADGDAAEPDRPGRATHGGSAAKRGVNPAGLDTYNAYEDASAAEVDAIGVGSDEFTSDALSVLGARDNGAHPDGNFRIICTAGFWANNDPIVKRGQPGASHEHMFWGNTDVDGDSWADGRPGGGAGRGDAGDNLLETGGSTCQGGALNRSSYWMPALLSGGAEQDQQVMIPKTITMYYKSKHPEDVKPLPGGIQLIAGNVGPGGTPNGQMADGPTERLSWGCYDPAQGMAVNQTATIPGTNGTPQCPNGWDIQASIQFPQCLATDDGTPNGNPVLSSDDFLSHTQMLWSEWGGNQNADCPTTHPYRVPQISYLVRWANPDGLGEAGWRLASDENAQAATGSVPYPGGSLHGDWLGGWNDNAIKYWIDGCFNPGGDNSRNCSLGQTGQDRAFNRITGKNLQNQEYTGPPSFRRDDG